MALTLNRQLTGATLYDRLSPDEFLLFCFFTSLPPDMCFLFPFIDSTTVFDIETLQP